jgi:hypothetical protein
VQTTRGSKHERGTAASQRTRGAPFAVCVKEEEEEEAYMQR